MEQVRATRAELLAKKNQIALARQGRNLLKEKRNALMQELMRTAEQVMRGDEELERDMGKATVALANKMARIGWAVLAHKTVYQSA